MRRAIKGLIQSTYGSKVFRRVLTSGFDSGLFALGECNHYFFPARFVTLDFGAADYSLRLTRDLRLPFKDETQRVAYAAHVLEHIDQGTLSHVLAEVYRVLKAGGGFRIEVPDSESLLNAYVAQDRGTLEFFKKGRLRVIQKLGLGEEYLEDQLTVVGEMASYIVRERNSGHVPVYASAEEVARAMGYGVDGVNALAQSKMTDAQRLSGGHNNALYWSKLQNALQEVGFSAVTKMRRGETIIPGLELGMGMKCMWRAVREKPHREFFSLYVDAIK